LLVLLEMVLHKVKALELAKQAQVIHQLLEQVKELLKLKEMLMLLDQAQVKDQLEAE
jgi:hypothetical protein